MKNIIFDFDGVIGNTFEIFVLATNELGKKYYNRTFSAEEVEKYRELSAKEILKKEGISLLRVPKLAIEGRKLMNKYFDKVEIFPGIHEVLRELKDEGYDLYLVTSNSEENIAKFDRKNDIKKYFKAFNYGGSPFGKGRLLKKFISKQGLKPEEVIYVGDEVRDIDAATFAGVKIISASWGYNKKSILLERNKLVAEKPQEIIKLIS